MKIDTERGRGLCKGGDRQQVWKYLRGYHRQLESDLSIREASSGLSSLPNPQADPALLHKDRET